MMEEWQRRQRAEKERERQEKKASANYLSGYRAAGLSEDDARLQALREEERRKKAEAAQTLHKFQNNKLPESLSSPRKTTHENDDDDNLPVPVNAGGSAGNDNIAFGSISAIKANFSSSRTSTDPLEAWASTAEMARTRMAPPLEGSDDNTETRSANDATTLPMHDNVTTVHMTTETTPVTVDTVVTNGDGSRPAVNVTSKQESNVTQPLTVYFKFGIITDDAVTPDATLTEPYATAIGDILKHDSTTTTSSSGGRMQNVTIVSWQRDETFADERPTVRRIVVTAAVEWLHDYNNNNNNGNDLSAIRTMVWNAVAKAIQSGQLLEQSRLYKE